LLFLYLRMAGVGPQVSAQESCLHALPHGDKIVQQATQFMRDHHAEELSLLEVAKAVGHSDRHIRQHFKEGLGISPRRYLLECRIQKAQELIQYSNYALKEIASRVGFKTVHHFTRAFHETCGETPGGWRRKYQAGICKDVNIDPEFVNTNWTIRLDVSHHGGALN
jgi:transcriptional regulator GlxA family with amidase domain